MLGFGSPASGKLAAPPSRTHKVCLVEASSDLQIINILQNNYECRLFQYLDGTRIFDCSTGQETIEDEDMVFYVSDFNSPAFELLLSKRPFRPVIGPLYVKSRFSRKLELTAPKTNRRIYCETMRDVTAAVNLPEEQKKHCLELIHYMGGHVRKDAYDKTNILVSNKAYGEDYRKMISIGQHKNIVLFSWVEECWQNRNLLEFNCFDPNLLSRHRLGTFEGLRMHFYCVHGDDYVDMNKHLLENKGSISDPKSATHIVYSHDAKSRVPVEDCNRYCKHVNVQWFWTSINANHCMLEQNYAFGVPEKCLESQAQRTMSSSSRSFESPNTRSSHSGRRSSIDKSSMNISADRLLNLASTPDYSYSNEELEKLGRSPRLDKRLQVCKELLETETNYINALNLLVAFKTALEEELENGNEALMPKNEIAMIFGKVEPIIEVHESICQEIEKIIEKYPAGGKDVCEVYTAAARDLERVYPPYINSYDFAKDCLNSFDEQNPRFHVFRKSKETNPDFKRNTVTELLIRPVQRLPSVILLMKEICKRSDKTQAAKAELAANTVDGVLRKANEVRQRNDQHIEHLALFNLIEAVPAHLVCSKRTFVSECEVLSVSGTGRWETLTEGRRIKMMLFNDVIIVCKIRDETRGLSRLTRQSSLSSFHRKPYKFFAHIMVQSMRTVQMLEDSSRNELSFVSSPQSSSYPQLFIYTIREDTEEATWIVEPINVVQMNNFNQLIHNRLFIDTGREFIIEELLPVSGCGHMSTVTAVNKYIRRWYNPRTASSTSFTSTLSTASMQRLDTSTLPPPQSTFKRSISSSTIATFTNRLMRHFSKSNLTKISEEQQGGSGSGTLRRANAPSSSHMLPPDRDGVELLITPRRNVERKRLTQNTFLGNLQRTLSRRQVNKPPTLQFEEDAAENSEPMSLPLAAEKINRARDRM